MTMRDRNDAEARPEQAGARDRGRRALLPFLIASIAAHAAVFGVLPGLQRESILPVVTLEVVLSVPEALAVAPQEPAAPRPPARSEPKRSPPEARPQPRHEPPSPVVVRPASRPEELHSFAVGAAAPEPEPASPAVPEQKIQAADAAVLPPISRAAYLRNPPPFYPLAARRAGEQGTVLLRVLITREGAASRVEIEKGSGSVHLDAAAQETVKAWRFTPARRGAEAIESWMRVPVMFRLVGDS
jgi:protein TonB